MKYKQTDKCFNEKINEYGCLFFSLMDIAEKYTGHNFIPKTIRELYKHLTETTFEKNGVEYPLMSKSCYINSHTKVLQDILEMFDCHDKVTYTGAEYLTDRDSWGKKYGMFLILQFKTKNGNGHFRRPHYDPYLPEITFTSVMSIRYYNIGI